MNRSLEYVLPLRRYDGAGPAAEAELTELTGYLRWLSRRVEVTVVDGSAPALFARHAARWGRHVRHVPPDSRFRYANGKVNGVLTGLRLARHEKVIIADDDVRYDNRSLDAVARLLDRADLVRPQNYFRPLPWHARWDTGRSLVNRALGADYPGTLGIRRSTFDAMGGYDGDVLFENLELIRTVRGYGGVELAPAGLYVRRLPPASRRFWSQRVRQAYDDLAQPARLLLFLAVGPALAGLAASGRRIGAVGALGAAAAVTALAERGRRRAGGTAVFPVGATLLAPVWVLERAVCGWLAVGLRLAAGGVRYGGRRLRVAAHSQRELTRRQAARRQAAAHRTPARQTAFRPAPARQTTSRQLTRRGRYDAAR
ncbi:glycosyltransferase [Plantactinospora sonchi]|uniref:Glycosyltransferase family 2 protein n=1 Tax=Plantactinospora sonchi TaxID=1544735 RepID=A0ABU7RLS6_9ACTN